MLRDIGRHFSVNRMLTMDSVKLRLEREQEMSFIEFNYMICQAYDFVELARRYGLQPADGRLRPVGQHRHGRRPRPAHGHAPALRADHSAARRRPSGAKMGKTAQGAVWLNEEQFSAYDFWQYWRNTEDADVGRFLKLFTTLPMAEIAKLAALQGAEINEAKKVLATEATALLHGREKAEAAAERRRRRSSRARPARGCRRWRSRQLSWRRGSACSSVREGGPRQIQRRGAPADSGRGGGLRVNDVRRSGREARSSRQATSATA